jgi:hypothetical protein
VKKKKNWVWEWWIRNCSMSRVNWDDFKIFRSLLVRKINILDCIPLKPQDGIEDSMIVKLCNTKYTELISREEVIKIIKGE